MSNSQRRKGAEFENAVALAVSGALYRDVRRNLSQTRDGGCDILAAPFVIECKRRKSMKTLYGWMRQVLKARDGAESAGAVAAGIPVVVARADQEPALVVMQFSDWLNLVTVAKRVGA